jgi:hypothetical protein
MVSISTKFGGREMSYAKCKLWFKKAIRMVMGYQPTLLPF